jgi:hypothetical protein
MSKDVELNAYAPPATALYVADSPMVLLGENNSRPAGRWFDRNQEITTNRQ